MLLIDLETKSTVPITHGTWAYAERAEILLFAYAIDDGEVRLWSCAEGEAMPADLCAALTDPSVDLWCHNSAFDRTIMLHCADPTIRRAAEQLDRWHCSMAKAYALALPGSLDKLGEALGIADDKRKLKTGKDLMRLFCIKPGEKMKRGWATYETHPAEWAEFKEYAKRDIDAMRECMAKLPVWNYKGTELALWRLDQKINARGIQVDLDLARVALEATDIARNTLADEATEATGGALRATTQRDALLKYLLAEHGVELPDLQASTLERRAEDPDLPDAVRELIANRLSASTTSVAKYKKFLQCASADGRLRGTLQYCGAARTGRWAGRLVQLQNLPRPVVSQQIIDAGIGTAKASVEDLGLVLGGPGDVMRWASSAIRGVIVASPGKRMVVADLANIEGRVAAWLAGEDWKLQAFRDYDTIIGRKDDGKPIRKGVDLYILAYAKAFNVAPESVPEKGPERQIGKVCLAGDTPVLTNRGVVPLEEVTTDHKLWDGVEWVKHEGLVANGVKSVVRVAGIHLTADHLVLTRTTWQQAQELVSNPSTLSQALETGSANLPWWASVTALRAAYLWWRFSALAGRVLTGCLGTTYARGVALAAIVAPRTSPSRVDANSTGAIATRCQIKNTACGCSTDWEPRSRDAQYLPPSSGPLMADAVSLCLRTGSKIAQLFSATSSLFLGGTTRHSRWTERTTTKGTNPEICASSPRRSTAETDVQSTNYSSESTNSNLKLPTFDLVCAGPRNRFTICTSRGPMIVHNCELMFQYGGGVGAWVTGAAAYGIDLDKMTGAVYPTLEPWAVDEAMGFLDYLNDKARAWHAKATAKLERQIESGVEVLATFEELDRKLEEKLTAARLNLPYKTFVTCDAIKRMWRRAHPALVSYWKEIEETIKRAIANPKTTFTCRKLKIRRSGSWLRIGLPSGRELAYPQIEVDEDGKISYVGVDQYTRNWQRISTYGPKCLENFVQAVARDQLAYPMFGVEEAGFEIVSHAHDELITEAPLDRPDLDAERLSELMCQRFLWNEGLPLAAEGFESSRYRK